MHTKKIYFQYSPYSINLHFPIPPIMLAVTCSSIICCRFSWLVKLLSLLKNGQPSGGTLPFRFTSFLLQKSVLAGSIPVYFCLSVDMSLIYPHRERNASANVWCGTSLRVYPGYVCHICSLLSVCRIWKHWGSSWCMYVCNQPGSLSSFFVTRSLLLFSLFPFRMY